MSDEIPLPRKLQSESLAIAALTHARTFLLQEADQRGRNFNYFLIVAGATTAALLNVETAWLRLGLLGLGAYLSVVFLIIDMRNLRLILDARAELYPIEEWFGIELHKVDRVRDSLANVPESGRGVFVRLTFAYRSIYVIAGLACAIGAGVVWCDLPLQ